MRSSEWRARDPHARPGVLDRSSGTSYHLPGESATVLTMSAGPHFTRLPHPHPATPQRRAEILAAPGFGNYFTDHMVEVCWTDGRGWHDPETARTDR